jgi:hypothetical protein
LENLKVQHESIELGQKLLTDTRARSKEGNPLSPPSAPVQGRLHGPPAKSKFLAAGVPA